jgi:aconitase A
MSYLALTILDIRSTRDQTRRPRRHDVELAPYSIRVLLEAQLRNLDGFVVTNDDVSGLAGYDAKNVNSVEMPFMPGRVVLQDFTGVPCVVDLAAMRDAMKNLGGDPAQINPRCSATSSSTTPCRSTTSRPATR